MNIFNFTLIIGFIWIITNIFEHLANKKLKKIENINKKNFKDVATFNMSLKTIQPKNQEINNAITNITNIYKNYNITKFNIARKKLTYSTLCLITVIIIWILTFFTTDFIWQLYPILSLLIINIMSMIYFVYIGYKTENYYHSQSDNLIKNLISHTKNEIKNQKY